MVNYMVDNPESYIFSALTASVNANVHFESNEKSGFGANMGLLSIPMDAQLLINDGQHRRKAIEEALHENPELGYENIAVLFFIDEGLKRSQQMFADLNKYAVRPSSSLGTLYDHRDQSSELARYLALTTRPFKGLTEMEKSSISNRSNKLFTLSGIKHASRALLRKGLKDPINDDEKNLSSEYWSAVTDHMPDWQQAIDKNIACAELRQDYIHAHGVALHALGHVGAALLSSRPKTWQKSLPKLKKIDWLRSNTKLWEGRAMVHGKISKARSNILLTANVIKRALGLELTPEEEKLEKEYTR